MGKSTVELESWQSHTNVSLTSLIDTEQAPAEKGGDDGGKRKIPGWPRTSVGGVAADPRRKPHGPFHPDGRRYAPAGYPIRGWRGQPDEWLALCSPERHPEDPCPCRSGCAWVLQLARDSG